MGPPDMRWGARAPCAPLAAPLQQPDKNGRNYTPTGCEFIKKNACEDFMPLSAEETLRLVHEVENDFFHEFHI